MTDQTGPGESRPNWKPTNRQPLRAPAQDNWADFTDWVIWLDDAYELNLMTCWMLHEGVVHTLSALWDAWLAVYSQRTAKAAQPPGDTARAAWHVQFRRPLLAEILDDKGPLAACVLANEHVAYRQRAEPTSNRLATALDAAACDPTKGITRGSAEYDRFIDLTGPHGAAAAVAVLYHDPKQDG
ncbi:MAG: DUF4913 domain-containing protein [Jatrophihabitans sp.]